MNLLDLTTVSFPSSTLYEEEINVLVSVANRFIEKYPESSRQILKGSFKLIGKHRSGTATDIMSFDFMKFASRTFHLGRLDCQTDLVEKSAP